MKLLQEKADFENQNTVYSKNILTFKGVDGFDVYNTSIPFVYDGKEYIFGRVEKREDWATSYSSLFIKTGKDEYTICKESMIYPLEDPYITFIDGELILGGTHVKKSQGKMETFFGYFYRGYNLYNLKYFTTGPERMKDIRLVQLGDSRIGVFSRPRGEDVRKVHGSEAIVGFTIINSIDELNAEVIENATKIENLFEKDQWGGCNQCYLLDSGLIGVIAHMSENAVSDDGQELLIYVNVSFVFDMDTHNAMDLKIIGTKASYPTSAAKVPNLLDCVFPSGIVMRDDGKVDMYSGIGDVNEGRIVIDYPFEGYGKIVKNKL